MGVKNKMERRRTQSYERHGDWEDRLRWTLGVETRCHTS
jgi:hypothetical protein